MSIQAEVICGQPAAKCYCEGSPKHEGPHTCRCGGSWTGEYGEATFRVLALPTGVWPDPEGG